MFIRFFFKKKMKTCRIGCYKKKKKFDKKTIKKKNKNSVFVFRYFNISLVPFLIHFF